MTEQELNALFDDAVRIRRQLHEYPEVGFDLPRTVALVAAELDALGIPHTDRYGTCSIVADIGRGEKTIALRADMDALPVEEKTGLPYASKIPGKMHACGHDSHTALMLAVAKHLKSHEDELPVRVRLIFQPSEEGAISGAKMMVDNGVMDGVDHILCTHCENELDAGAIGVCYGDYMAACIPATIRFLGKSTHAALPHAGVDAIAMAVTAYCKFKEAIEREANGARYIWSVGRFSGGQVHNVVADRCEMDVSFRFYDMDLARRMEAEVRRICEEVAIQYGGETEIDWHMSTGAVYNTPMIVEAFERALATDGLPAQPIPQRMSSEDFGWYLERVPGMIFRFGTRNEALGCTATAHRSDFRIDERGMKNAIRAFCAYVLRCDTE
ncbi:MAG: amidohydrolase [Clostridia bacterium]|nr:amidohydrolase [Clostridia bacterium]